MEKTPAAPLLVTAALRALLSAHPIVMTLTVLVGLIVVVAVEMVATAMTLQTAPDMLIVAVEFPELGSVDPTIAMYLVAAPHPHPTPHTPQPPPLVLVALAVPLTIVQAPLCGLSLTKPVSSQSASVTPACVPHPHVASHAPPLLTVELLALVIGHVLILQVLAN